MMPALIEPRNAVGKSIVSVSASSTRCSISRPIACSPEPKRGTRSRRPAMEPKDRVKEELERLELVAGNGLLDRRTFLRSGAAFAAAVTGYTVARSAGAAPLKDDPWSLVPGAISPSYEQRSR